MLIPTPIDIFAFLGLVFIIAILEWVARRRKAVAFRPILIATALCAMVLGSVLLSNFHNHSRRGPPIDFQTTAKAGLLAGLIPIAFAGFQIHRGQVRDYFGGRHFRNESPGSFWFYIVVMAATSIGLIAASALAIAMG